MNTTTIARRVRRITLALGLTLSAAAAVAAPVSLNVVDVAGNLQLTRGAIEAFREKNPNLVSNVTFTNAPAPQLPGKIKAMQAAGRSDIDLVLTGTDALAAGIEQNLWMKLLPDNAGAFPGVLDKYAPGPRKMQDVAQGFGLEVTYMPAGPLLEYNPAKVSDPPKTPAQLLAWCKAHPNKLIYARPANSGPGRTFLMGLPYVLGDKNPQDPINGWDKTWAFLKQLNDCIPYYPGGTSAVMKELGEGTRDMTVTVTGWDLNPRALGIVPADFRIQAFDGMTWVNDAHYMVIPKGVPKEKLDALFKLMNFLLEPAQQAMTYDDGYFYPGPAVKGVTLDMAPAHSQEVIRKFGRPEYAKLLAERPHVQPLNAQAMVAAFQKWDREIGSQKSK
ncbi:bacterial extracellular solute-binding family protein [Burkholderia ambifaria AMMD]|uniref:ABC transporter, periplasmic ligand binding protein n=1 Tax=Burkholderia ambifaria (strain ATCC BAA-244 / DSM 16087 / CCUG 44356 / LMG 19182 / AMMD) TaxID=339670 RepID=Q0BFC5_BURCM|nr:extracellular solute-binding protein [Burkholderia ambifaria]ABI87148.1 ABC transporter, periplasmic ligand binding protein [Burkholderia ambifaria AMMD]AJY22289.1 bacterial extracellular solute-binding family protein [Burkholderia ambifaria AMMD]MBR7928637.1 extracellular solute-binding protein [Burkholderia ambifaria]PEH65623.1 ABC transporter substrate-binding protein [Burkholderia ambifaria]QQC05630.1 extracellular solute-binding protein [Burkholderia ambifaria]